MNEKEDDEGGADADGEAKDVDKREGFVAPEAAYSDEEIVLKHRRRNGCIFGR